MYNIPLQVIVVEWYGTESRASVVPMITTVSTDKFDKFITTNTKMLYRDRVFDQ